LIVFSQLPYAALRPRPILFAENFAGPLAVLPQLLDAVVVPQITDLSSAARQRAQAVVDAIVNGLARGERFVLWPAGRLYRQGAEALRSQSAVAEVLMRSQPFTLVLLRTRGMWGSRFSWAYTGRVPQLNRELLHAAWLLFWSLGGLLLPRRNVVIEIERYPSSVVPATDRHEVNRWLEAWFNAPGPEQPSYVGYHTWSRRHQHVFPPVVELDEHNDTVLDEPTERVLRALLTQYLGDIPAELAGERSLEELGLDSLERMALAHDAQQRFGFTANQVPTTVGQLRALASGRRGPQLAIETPRAWLGGRFVQGKVTIEGETIAAAFLARAQRDRAMLAVADNLSGVLSYGRLLIGAWVLARRIRQCPDAAIGVMLPASVGCDLALLACHLAGKLPVMINWTTGEQQVAHACRTLALTRVLTSVRFLDRVAIDLTACGVEPWDLAELRASVGRVELLWTALRVHWGGIPRVAAVDPETPAVVLFTSGSEREPKAVPLSHRNLIANMRASLAALAVDRADVMLGFLPPFHSFGLTVTSLLPLLGGVRLVHHADPTDSATLARMIEAYRVTLTCATPTFLAYILESAGDFSSLRAAAVGAEACPQALFERFAARVPGAELLEGYGITECSPVVAVNSPGTARRGSIGRPLPGFEILIVDAENPRGAPVAPGAMGRLLVRGPSVFAGYLGAVPAPFIERDGTSWYDTADLVTQDPEGYLQFRGRLKRFIKAGGEMISLPAIEAPLLEQWPPTDQGPRVAVEGTEREGRRWIVLFTTEPIELREANGVLQAHGFSGLLRLDAVERLTAIPVLGTGKIDYKLLRQRLESVALSSASG
jgi:long-chain-fatty-acid--[acyl-carrier-protein] ligase